MICWATWSGSRRGGPNRTPAAFLAAMPSRVRRRDEWSRPGVYLLTGPSAGETSKDRLYIGEADDVRDRLDNHFRNKEFWTSVIAFTSKDDNLNKAHVRYLEARLIQAASEADRVAVENNTAPPLPRLSEADRADMEGYLAEMLVILPVLGVMAFESVARAAPATDLLRLTAKQAEASGADGPEGFVVFEGSLARLDEVTSIHPYLTTLRQRLVSEGVGVELAKVDEALADFTLAVLGDLDFGDVRTQGDPAHER
jgi:hypothetical protein